jgi:hypothetical protein
MIKISDKPYKLFEVYSPKASCALRQCVGIIGISGYFI